MTIPEVIVADDNTPVTVKGTVKRIDTAWSDSYGNISVTIVDGEGNELYLYRLSTKVELGDVITVKGLVGSYNGNKQIAAGATAEITGCEAVLESVGVSLDTGVTIRVTYYIPEKLLTANAGAKVVFTCEGETKEFDAVSGSNTYYVNLAPTLMNKTVTAKIVDAEGGVLSAEEDVSLSTYRAKLEAADAAALGISEDKKAKALALIDAALKASAAANNELGEETVVVGDFTASEITRDEKVSRVYGTLGANASLIVYINSVSAESAVTVTVGDAVTDKFVFDNGVLIIGGICHTKLNDTIVVSVDGTDVLTLTFNSYLKAIYDNDSVDAMNKNLAAATYLYGVAAEAYISAE